MKKLSTGEDSTLGNYRKITVAIFGEKSKALDFFDKEIKESPNGENEEVIADEGQMIYLISSLNENKS